MIPLPVALLFSVLAAATLVSSANVGIPLPDNTVPHDLAPRATETGISPIQCTLQLSIVQCCQEVEPLSAVFGILDPIFSDLGIPLPPLGTIVALNCQPMVLGLGCAQSTLCCLLVVPNQNIGVDCQPVASLL